MSRPRSFSRDSASYQRRKPNRQPSGKTFLIVTEGKKTEPNYLITLRDQLQLAAADVKILHPDGTDPLTLTKKAIELRDERKKQAKKGNGVAYDEVWVVFDLEKPHDLRRKLAKDARNLKRVADIKFAISDPCFEYWLLLHEEYTTAPFVDCNTVETRLKDYWRDYAKGLAPTTEFLKKLPAAVTHAQRCREHHQTAGGDGNPTTDVDRLARSLNEATRPYLQINLT